ncbi:MULTISPECIES: DNA polymerase III subunit gamma and tau [unclassified Cryobacterium]|uniref:DNA polymerase III subunit gamma and tau n=1 Tax=unclassified Cryobacterium TaxID=2649013 RepID=UPI002AB490EA|nr:MULTISPECIES: DNA polymerase III subunit gamma and tau [unclassified Cryobacterium]MDY7529153.1 DNA polymerase III subunit gamma and tau [Cryobacterium sp. 10C2]MEB0201892.1 DNA polymerase III subunit gamma and tau [Cryobacterium sp. 5I3]MEB0290572.1 DNA polymerase III subunit gamma and tau [Cryobacterium sp. 10C2]
MVTALYRRYRPETFAEMIGQSQVTEPLMTALRTNRVNHAYLFSGPRGCGKTTSARILARCLNCAEGPTDTPCGVCPSCVELSRDGGGSLDVVEIDAASHNGVDDARDIRERAIFAPARDRYKIFILDEAHMVTPQGFNALLKIVEEPPEHVKFIFATTEPEKVIGTIRSRTHHYPFRLVPPGPMLEYVQTLCESEKVAVAPGVLPLVVRAGGGSPRDTLSLLDQLMAGSDDHSVDYDRAVALLGYTSASLLDESIDAIAARDPAAAFDAVDRVIQTGQDPRRFVEDLLERMRDLIVVAATSAAGASAVLRGVPQDEIERMAVQAAKFGPAELSRTADILNTALTEMTGATSPRLHLELMIARVLIPASDDSTRGALARVERLERRIGVGRSAVGASDVGTSGADTSSAASVAPSSATPAVSSPTDASHAPDARPVPVADRGAPAPEAPVTPAVSTVPTSPPAGQASVAPAVVAAARPIGPVTFQQVKDAWPEVLEAVQTAKTSAWLVLYTANVLEFRDGDLLVLSFPSQKDVAGLKQSAAPGEGVGDYLKRAVNSVLGFTPRLIAKVTEPGASTPVAGPSAVPSASPAPEPQTSSPAAAASQAAPPAAAVSDGAADTPFGRPDASASPTGPSATAGSNAPTRASAQPASAPRSTPVEPTGSVTAWATVAIPGAGDASTGATAPATAPAATAAPAAAAPNAATPAPSAPAAPGPTASAARQGEPPYDDEPPPYDDSDVPPDEDTPPDRNAGSARQGQNRSPARQVPPAPEAQPAPVDRNVTHTGPNTIAPNGRRSPAFEEKQRYGESVVREVLGATFLEEQPYEPAPRTRGD